MFLFSFYRICLCDLELYEESISSIHKRCIKPLSCLPSDLILSRLSSLVAWLSRLGHLIWSPFNPLIPLIAFAFSNLIFFFHSLHSRQPHAGLGSMQRSNSQPKIITSVGYLVWNNWIYRYYDNRNRKWCLVLTYFNLVTEQNAQEMNNSVVSNNKHQQSKIIIC